MSDNIYVGLIGFGTVGTGIAKILLEQQKQILSRLNKNIILKKIVDIDINKNRGLKLPNNILSTEAADIIDDPEISIVIEAIGGTMPAESFVLSALRNKKHVVTPNKELIAKRGKELFQVAKKNNVNIFYEAAVGGGIPIIRPLSKCLAANTIESVYGIINGTTNYILSKMTREQKSFDDILKEAQIAGYAEANPSSDIKGYDAQYKIKILVSLAFNVDVPLEKIYCEGITKVSDIDIKYATEFGYVIKLLAIAKKTSNGIDIRVHPTFIREDHALANVNDTFNAVFVHGNNVGETMFYGQGAGMLPTASAVVADIIDLARDSQYRGQEMIEPEENTILSISNINSKYYLRLNVVDQPGVLAKISNILGNYNVSITTVLQKDTNIDKGTAELIIITNTVQESKMQQAFKEIGNLSIVNVLSNIIRVGLE